MNKEIFFIGSGGDLVRKSDCAVIRPKYSFHFSGTHSAAQVAACLRAGKFAWPGGYPCFLVTRDGAALCFDCARKEWRQVVWDFLNDASTGWRVEGCDVNYEDPALFCDHCSKRIESAYAEDEAK